MRSGIDSGRDDCYAASVGQRGGITANKVVFERDAWWKVAAIVISTLAGIVTILTWFRIQPKEGTAQPGTPIAQLDSRAAQEATGAASAIRPRVADNSEGRVARRTSQTPGVTRSAKETVTRETASRSRVGPEPVLETKAPSASAAPAPPAASPQWAFALDADGQRLARISIGAVDDTNRGAILTALQASSRSSASFTADQTVNVMSADLVESNNVPGCAVAVVATLRYETHRPGAGLGIAEHRSATGHGACIGADRKEATVLAVESAAIQLKSQLTD